MVRQAGLGAERSGEERFGMVRQCGAWYGRHGDRKEVKMDELKGRVEAVVEYLRCERNYTVKPELIIRMLGYKPTEDEDDGNPVT